VQVVTESQDFRREWSSTHVATAVRQVLRVAEREGLDLTGEFEVKVSPA
jgi:hypothetical protein